MRYLIFLILSLVSYSLHSQQIERNFHGSLSRVKVQVVSTIDSTIVIEGVYKPYLKNEFDGTEVDTTCKFIFIEHGSTSFYKMNISKVIQKGAAMRLQLKDPTGKFLTINPAFAYVGKPNASGLLPTPEGEEFTVVGDYNSSQLKGASPVINDSPLIDNGVITAGGWYIVDVASGAVNLTVNIDATKGDSFKITGVGDVFNNNITIAFSGDLVYGVDQNYIINGNQRTITFTYISDTIGWVAEL